jgi:hypothetical protein
MVNAICNTHAITEPHQITLACDNKSALWKAFDDNEPRHSDASSDVLMAIRYQMKESPLQWESKWVKGHQDDGDDVLDEWAIENIEVDNMAGQYWTKMVKELTPVDMPFWERMEDQRRFLRPESTTMPGETWQLRLGGDKVVGRIDDLVYDHCHKEAIIEYWISKGRFTEEVAETIDWESHHKAMKAFGPRRHWVTKHFSGWAGSGENMQKWGYRSSAECPRCPERESTLHVMRCKSESADDEFWEATESFAEWLVSKTSEDIGQAILDQVLACREDRSARIYEEWPEEVQQASLAQIRAGNRSMAEGLPTRHWRYITQSRNQTGDSVEKGLRWTSALIQKQWEISWSMWTSRNDVVHNDGEVRDTLVIKDLDLRMKRLQQEGAKCRNLFRDDRRFFKKPHWKLVKKTEQQKIRYIETAMRLLEESQKSVKQTLDKWRIEESDDSSENSTDGSLDQERIGSVVTTQTLRSTIQTKLITFFEARQASDTSESIDGGTSDELDDGRVSSEVTAAMVSMDDITSTFGDQPSAGRGQPSADFDQPSAGRVRPTAGMILPSAGSDRPSADPDSVDMTY